MRGIFFKPDIWEAKQKVLAEKGMAVARMLDGLKEINQEPGKWEVIATNSVFWTFWKNSEDRPLPIKPPYHLNEVVYIKEAWWEDSGDIYFKSDLANGQVPTNMYFEKGKWKSPLFLKEIFAKSFVKITDVRAERLQEITPEDARLEGIDQNKPWGFPDGYINSFAWLWDSTYSKYPWVMNCWLWRIVLAKAERPA